MRIELLVRRINKKLWSDIGLFYKSFGPVIDFGVLYGIIYLLYKLCELRG